MKYIDLGLPSETLWAVANEEGFYTFDEAVETYGDRLPTYEQFEELKEHCKWEWNGGGYDIIGPNCNTIVLPAAGFIGCNGGVFCVGSLGRYWSSSPVGLDQAWFMYFNSGDMDMFNGDRCSCRSVRLIKER